MKKIITISGTSGVGKSFFIDQVIQTFPCITEIAGVTTRTMRNGEIQGQSSHFITLDEFKKYEEEKKLILIKNFFGKKYAWFKDDLVNGNEIKIMNISYKSIQELKDNNLEIYSFFIRPCSQERIKEILKLRKISEKDYNKRLLDYNESEEYITKYSNVFDYIFTNNFNRNSVEEFLSLIGNKILYRNSTHCDKKLEDCIMEMIEKSNKIDKKLQIATDICKQYLQKEMKDETSR